MSAVLCSYLLGFASAHISNLDLTGRVGIAQVPDRDDGAVETNPGGCALAVDPVVREARQDRVVERAPRKSVGNHGPNQEPSYRRVPVGKV